MFKQSNLLTRKIKICMDSKNNFDPEKGKQSRYKCNVLLGNL